MSNNGDFDLRAIVPGKRYDRAYNKFILRNEENTHFFVPPSAWMDETGITQNLCHPIEPLLVNYLLAKENTNVIVNLHIFLLA